jgi:hypothetical protein
MRGRQNAGIGAAKAMGTYKGRKKSVDDVEIRSSFIIQTTAAQGIGNTPYVTPKQVLNIPA